MRRSSNKSQSIKPGGARKQQRIKGSSNRSQDSLAKAFGVSLKSILRLAERAYEIVFKLCQTLFLVPFTSDPETGKVIAGSLKRRCMYNLIVFIRVLTLLCKARIIAVLLSEGNIELGTFLSICSLLIDLTAICFTVATSLKPDTTIDYLNSWKCVSVILKDIRAAKTSPFQDFYCCVEVLFAVAVVVGIFAALVMVFFVFPNLPIFWFNALNSWGIFPKALGPVWAWRILFLPIEMLPYFGDLCTSGYNSLTPFICFAVCKILAQGIRRIPIRNLEDRKKVEQLCVTFGVENKIVCCWLKYMLPPGLLVLFFTIVITLYITIAYTYLPLYIYVFFPFFGVVLMGLIFIISNDESTIVRTMDSVMLPLLDSRANYLRWMTKKMRMRLMKRARALQPVSHPIGAFGKYSMNVPVTVWEEVMNQLLFLLSL